MSVTSFKELYCKARKCTPEQFERRCFWEMLYRHALPFAVFIFRRNPSFFSEDIDFIRHLAECTSTKEVIGELNRFYGRNVREKAFVRRTFLIRVSGGRVLRIQRDLSRTLSS